MSILEELAKKGIRVKNIKLNTKFIEEGDLFFCIPGFSTDKHDYIEDAARKGAVASVVTKDVASSIPTIMVGDINKALYDTLSEHYNNIDKKIKLIGVTGTDGKTTTSTIIYKILNKLEKCGYIGTNGVECNDFFEKSVNTTPGIDKLYRVLSSFYDCDCKYASMEVSSLGLKQNRIGNLSFDCTIFTNLTYDHMNFHGTFDDYCESKKKLFKRIKPDGFAVINIDDPYALEFIQETNARVITYGKNDEADIKIVDVGLSLENTDVEIEYQGNRYRFISSLLGEFNVYNLCGAIGALVGLGYDMNVILEQVSDLSIDNRMQRIDCGQDFDVLVDFAHTINGYTNVLSYFNQVRKGKIITVAGSIGGRDYKERREKGKVISDLSDYVFFTVDDCVNERPEKVLYEMTNELDNANYCIVLDRKDAIKQAINIAEKGDIVFISGRCGLSTINIMGVEYECDDIKVACSALSAKKDDSKKTTK